MSTERVVCGGEKASRNWEPQVDLSLKREEKKETISLQFNYRVYVTEETETIYRNGLIVFDEYIMTFHNDGIIFSNWHNVLVFIVRHGLDNLTGTLSLSSPTVSTRLDISGWYFQVGSISVLRCRKTFSIFIVLNLHSSN